MRTFRGISRRLGGLILALLSLTGGLGVGLGDAVGQTAELPQLTLSVNRSEVQVGDELILTATLTPGLGPWVVDVYLAILLPDQPLLFLQLDGGFTLEPTPFVAGWSVVPVQAEVFRYTFSGGETPGTYVWLGALIMAGTGALLGDIAQAPFTFGGPLFSDDFADGTADDWTVVAGQWSVLGGELAETSDSSTHNMAIAGPEVVDFQLTAHLRSTDDDDIGLVLRFQDSNNYYAVLFSDENNRIQVRRRVGGAFITLAQVPAHPYLKGIPVEVTVRAAQAHLQVFLNGRTVIELDVPEVTRGRIGLYSRANKFAAFDNIRLVTLNTLKPIRGNIIHVDVRNAGGIEDGLTPATAWGTITKALEDPRFRDSAGNTILIQAGVYYEQVNVFGRMSGIAGAFNTIRAADGAEVIIDGERDTPNARVEGVLIHNGVSHVRIESLTIRNAQHRGVLVFDSGPGEIVGNRIHSCADTGLEFWFGAHHYDVVGNAIFRNDGDGIDLSQGSGDDPSRFAANQGIILRNNLIVENGRDGDDGIQVKGDQPHTFAIHNNTVINNFGNGIFIDAGVGAGDIRNNIIAFNRLIGLKNFANLLTNYNNLFANGSTGDRNYDDLPPHEDPGSGSISADPLFVNPAVGDFRLQAGSPSINAGDPDPRFTDTDTTRNDMGAYGGPATLLSVPLRE